MTERLGMVGRAEIEGIKELGGVTIKFLKPEIAGAPVAPNSERALEVARRIRLEDESKKKRKPGTPKKRGYSRY